VENTMSETQARIYDFITRYIDEHGRPPTNREIGRAVDIASTGHVDYHLTVLEKKGLITRERKTSRGIALAQEQRGLPIQGAIAAGLPLEIYQEPRHETLDLSCHRRGREYVLQVRGRSMIEDHIADGDYVLVDGDARIEDGDIVVATHTAGTGERGNATLKRIYKEADQVRLQPANSEMDPIYIAREEWDHEWTVQGKVTAVYRKC
jgi:repressor LexA